MSVITISENALVSKDPADAAVYTADWDAENLAAAVTVVTSTWTITALAPSVTDAILTQDQASILTGGRKTSVRLSAGTLGQLYEVANKIVTSETPAQTKERSFRLLVQNR
jgi:hypothetical protein